MQRICPISSSLNAQLNPTQPLKRNIVASFQSASARGTCRSVHGHSVIFTTRSLVKVGTFGCQSGCFRPAEAAMPDTRQTGRPRVERVEFLPTRRVESDQAPQPKEISLDNFAVIPVAAEDVTG